VSEVLKVTLSPQAGARPDVYNIIKTLSLTADLASDRVNEGEFIIEPGYICRGVRMRYTGSVNNSNAGTTTLTGATKLAILNKYQTTFKWGRAQNQQPFQKETGGNIRECSREIAALEVDRYSDTTIGLGQTLNGSGTNSGNTQVQFTLYLPLGRNWKLEQQGIQAGMGVAQMKTAILEVKRLADSGFQANLTSTGTWTIDIIADTVPNEGKDVLFFAPELTAQMSIADYNKVLPDGLYWYVVEQTAAQASTSLTFIDAYIGDYQFMDNFDPKVLWGDILADEVPFSGAPQITDTDTVLFRQRYDEGVQNWHVGSYRIVQTARVLNPMLLKAYYQKVPSEQEIDDAIQYLCDSERSGLNKAIKVTAGHAHLPSLQGIPERLIPFMPMAIVEKGDEDFGHSPGKVAFKGGGQPEVVVPEGVKTKAKIQAAHHHSHGNPGGATQVAKAVTLAVPGSVQHSRGVGHAPSAALRAVTSHLAQPVQAARQGPRKAKV